MRTLLPLLALMSVSMTAMAGKLTIDRIFNGGDLSGPAPREVKFSPDGARVSFLRAKADDQHTFDLWVYDIASKHMHLLVDSAKLASDDAQLSMAEKARRERQRSAGMHGILHYQWSSDASKLLIPDAGKLFLYDLSKPQGKRLSEIATGGQVIDPKLSPKGGYVSWVRDQNLWVLDLASGDVSELTHDGGGTVHNAQAEFVAQEEMARETGYWWAPDDSAIAYERYDAAPVPVTKRMEIYADHVGVVKQRYPFAGDANVRVKLGLIAPTGGKTRWVHLGKNKDIYLVRVKWLPQAKRLSYQRMARDQKTLVLRFVDAATLKQKTVLTETSKTWIHLNQDLYFLKDQPAFLWGSERDGWHHLFLYGDDGTLKHAIGAGDWRIDGRLGVDEKHGLVYVASNRAYAPDTQVYALKLDGSTANAPKRISKRDGVHHAVFSDDGRFYVDTFANPTTPPQVSLHQADGKLLAWIEQNPLGPGHPYWPYHDDHIVPSFGTLTAADGQTLYYRIYKPLGFDPHKSYPVFDTFYGGPGVQMVQRGWVDYFAEYMAQQGFVVFSLDNRGTARRGRKFSDVLYHQFGVAEVADQAKGIAWLQSQPWVDAKRIGVFGWSYGGYLSLMMLCKDSTDLAGGVAVAPVTDWTLYDTFYTERYLGTPQDNAVGYQRSSPFAWLDGLTSPLYLVAGMADDNVLFLNSTKLMTALQQRGVQFQLMTYPGAKHGLNLPGERAHVYHLIADFFEHTIKGDCGEQCRVPPPPAAAASTAPPPAAAASTAPPPAPASSVGRLKE